MTTAAGGHPLLPAFLAVDAALTGPGGPFELAEEEVLGERQSVFAQRPRSLRDLLARAATFGETDCYVFSDGRRTTFAELPGEVASAAAWLRDEHGIGPGDRVAICAANGAGWLLAQWAIVSLGAVVVAMNGWWTELEMRNALDLTEPKLLLIDEKRGERLGATPGLARADVDAVVDEMVAHARDAALPDQPIAEDDPAILLFTSGTTGRPKAAVITHRCAIAYVMLQVYIGARAAASAPASPAAASAPTAAVPFRAVRLAVFPLFHVSGLGLPFSAALTGTTTVWPLGRFDAGRVIELTLAEGITMWGGTVTHLMRLLDHPDLPKVDPAQIVQVGMGGSATTPDIMRRCDERFPHLAGSMSSGYGSTEVGGLASYAPNWMLLADADCVGSPLPTVSIRITDEDGHPVPDGVVGDIWVRSPLVMPGYWRHPEADAEVFAPGRWFRTGDFGRLEDGLLFIASRVRDLIIRGGENVYPFEIENRLEEHPDVVECAVIGVDHPELGQAVKAIVVVAPAATVTVDELLELCRAGLASYKVPAQLELRHERLPRNATGKIMKHVLEGGDSGFVEE